MQFKSEYSKRLFWKKAEICATSSEKNRDILYPTGKGFDDIQNSEGVSDALKSLF